MLIFMYPSKKVLKESIGHPLKYQETSFFDPEYKPDGNLFGSNRPSITQIGTKEFFAKVTMKDGLIAKVENVYIYRSYADKNNHTGYD